MLSNILTRLAILKQLCNVMRYNMVWCQAAENISTNGNWCFWSIIDPPQIEGNDDKQPLPFQRTLLLTAGTQNIWLEKSRCNETTRFPLRYHMLLQFV